MLKPRNWDATRWIVDFFKGEDVFIVGGGPSLHGFDFDRLKEKKVIAINRSYLYVTPDVLIFLDNRFKQDVLSLGHKFEEMPFRVIAGPCSGLKTGGNITSFYYSGTVTNDPCKMYGMYSSALVAINAALIMGAARIFLMGIDCCFHEGRGHFFSDDWQHYKDKDEDNYKRMAGLSKKKNERQLNRFKPFERFKNIFNLSPISLLTSFPKMDLEAAL